MKLSFALTYDEFTDAHEVNRRPPYRARLGLGERLLFLWILLGGIGAIFVIAIVEVVARLMRGAPPGTELTVTNWAVAIAVPWFIYLVIFTLLWYVASGVMGPTERPSIRQMFLLMAAITLVTGTVSLIATGGPAAQRRLAARHAEDEPPWIVTALPWLTMLVVIWFYIFRYLRRMLPRHWDNQPQLRLPTTIERTDRGLRVEDEHTVHDFRWSAFLKFREGERLFLIYVSHVAFLIVPKRALAEPGQVEAFRQMLEQHVAGDGPVPARFPLHQPLPAAAPAPT